MSNLKYLDPNGKSEAISEMLLPQELFTELTYVIRLNDIVLVAKRIKVLNNIKLPITSLSLYKILKNGKF